MGFTAAAPSGSGLVVQCRRSLPSSRRGQRWLLQGHCTELINGPSYVAAVCLMSLITTDHTSRPETHTPTHTLGVIRARLLPFLPPSCHFTSDRDRNSSMQLTPVLSTACTVCLLAHFCPCTHVYTLKNRERER